MKIGDYKDRIAIETKSRILRLYCTMKEEYNPHDSITDIGTRKQRKGFKRNRRIKVK